MITVTEEKKYTVEYEGKSATADTVAEALRALATKLDGKHTLYRGYLGINTSPNGPGITDFTPRQGYTITY